MSEESRLSQYLAVISSDHSKIDSLILAALDGNDEIIIVLNMLDVNHESDTRSCFSAKFGATVFLGGQVKNR
jgi:hypothetical protein